MKLDTTIDFTLDCPGYYDNLWTGESPYMPRPRLDPDTKSRSLAEQHKLAWSKPLPNGETMELAIDKNSSKYYLRWKDFCFASDSCILSFCYYRMVPILSQLFDSADEFHRFLEDHLHRSYTLGGMMIWPCHTNSINQRKGTSPKIGDRLDRTLECIRRFYVGELSPLTNVFESDRAFFELFVDFKGFVDFFLLNDMVSDDYMSVDMWLGDNTFSTPALPQNVDEYRQFYARQREFMDKRNARIQAWAEENGR